MENLFFTFHNNKIYLLLYTLLVIVFSIIFIYKRKEKIFSCVTLFYLFYLAFIAIGPIFLGYTENYNYHHYNVYFIITLSAILFFLGTYIGTKIKLKKMKPIKFLSIQNVNFESVRKNSIFLILVSYICWAIYFIPRISFIFQDFENNRILAMSGNGILIHFTYIMLPATWALYYYHVNCKKCNCVYAFLIIDLILLLLLGFKSRVIELILIIIMIKNSKYPFNLKKVIRFGIILVVLLIGMQVLRYFVSNNGLESISNSIVKIFGVGSINLQYVFDRFPENIPFQYGKIFFTNSTLWLKEQIGREFAGGGLTPTIIGEWYINFGILGIIFGILLMGVIASIIDKIIENKNNKLIYYILILFICRTVTSGIANFTVLCAWFMCVTYGIFKFEIFEFEYSKFLSVDNKKNVFIKKVFKGIVRIFSKLFMKVIKPKNIVIFSHGMHNFDGSPKYIFLKLNKKENLNFEYYWMTQSKDEYLKYKDIYENFRYAFSLKSMVLIFLAKVYVISISVQDVLPGLRINNHRRVIQTWHGTPIKTLGKTATKYYTEDQIQKQIIDCFNPNTTKVVVSGKLEEESFIKCFDVKDKMFLRVGHPRNDQFKDWQIKSEACREKLPCGKDKKYILYCPTWREDEDFELLPFTDKNINKFNDFLVENNYIFILKLHPLYGSINNEIKNCSNIISYNKNWGLDTQELMIAVDILITDYSSMFFEYILMDKPVIFLPYDKEKYIRKRGFNYDYDKMIPGPQVNSFSELEENLLRSLNDKNYYAEKRNEIKEKFNGYFNFDASEKIIKYINKYIVS